MTKTERDQLIEALISNNVQVNSGENDWYLRDILYNGCRGYTSYTDEELITEAENNSVEIWREPKNE